MHKNTRYTMLALVLIMAVLVMSQPAGAATNNAPLPAGTTLYSVAQSSTVVSMSSTTPAALPGMSTSFTIPAGKTGDVMALFCGSTRSQSITVVKATVAGLTMPPGALALAQKSSVNLIEGKCANFLRLGVGAGTKTVKIFWYASPMFGPATQEMSARSLIVIVNLH